jgi:hypothetical protein
MSKRGSLSIHMLDQPPFEISEPDVPDLERQPEEPRDLARSGLERRLG